MKALTTLSFLLLAIIIIAGCSGEIITPPTRTSDSQVLSISIQRAWPSMGIIGNADRAVAAMPNPIDANGYNPGGNNRISPVNYHTPDQKPYAFVLNTSAWYGYYWGKVYYSPGGTETPYCIYEGAFGGTSVAPCGDWVFFIRVDDAYIVSGHAVITSTPVRYNVKTGITETLAQAKIDPSWNYIVPAKNGNMYLIGAMDFSTLSGETRIVDNGNLVHQSTTSVMFPDVSDDGTTAIWAEYHDAFPAGEVNVYLFDISTKAKRMIYQVPPTVYRNTEDFEFWESEYTHISGDGEKAAFTVVYFDKANGGAYDNAPYHWNGLLVTALPNPVYRWCQGISISPNGDYVTWPAANYQDSSGINKVRSFRDGVTTDIASWVATYSIIDPWLNVSDDAVILYGNHVGYKHYNPTYVDIMGGTPSQICDMGGPCTFFAYDGNKASAM